MKIALVTVEESHYAAPKATDYPYNVWLEGRWFHLETGEEIVELGDEITVKYHPQDQIATVDRKAKLPPSELEKQTEKIFNYLQSSRFEKWYKDDGQFGCYCVGDEFAATGNVPTKEQILEHIQKHFLN
jgi:hypothetical protein